MSDGRLYTVDQVARLLDLHVKTVRGYVRDGRLRGTRVGKRYLIAADDLAAFTGQAAPPAAGPHAETSTIVQVDAIDRHGFQRLSALLSAPTQRGPGDHGPLRIETVYTEERAVLKIILIGDLGRVAAVLQLIDLYVREVS